MTLLRQGMSIAAVSRTVAVSRWCVRDWAANGTHPRGATYSPCPVCTHTEMRDRLFYAALLGYYLGDGCVSDNGRTFSLRVSCDAHYPGIIDDVADCMRGVHPNGAVSLVNGPGAVVVQQWWKHWPCLFPQHGPGLKHKRSLALEGWQRKVIEEFPADFLRGLFHSDGCRTNNWTSRVVAGSPKRYDYPRWQFVNSSEEIRLWCTEALDLLGIPWRQSNARTISVSRREGVARLDDLIGLKH